MPSLDDLTVAIRAAVDQVRSLAAGAGASREQAEGLRDRLVDLGAERPAGQVGATADALQDGQAIAGAITEQLEAALAAVEEARGGHGSGAVTARGGGAPASSGGGTGNKHPTPPLTPAPGPEPEPAPKSSGVGPTAVTRPRLVPDPARRPSGEPTPLDGSAGKQEDLRKENESAQVLSRAGYDIEQNPPPRPNGKEPDYRMQGDYWDCYAPSGDNVGTVETAIRRKVGKTEAKVQADRIILNLDNFDLDHTAIRAHLERFPIRRLKEIKIVKHGKVTQFYPWDSEVGPHGD